MQLDRLKEWRQSRGLIQKKLAEDAGVNELTVVRAERGYSVKVPTARKLAAALGVEVIDLVAEPPMTVREATAAGKEESRQGREAEQPYRKLADLSDELPGAFAELVETAFDSWTENDEPKDPDSPRTFEVWQNAKERAKRMGVSMEDVREYAKNIDLLDWARMVRSAERQYQAQVKGEVDRAHAERGHVDVDDSAGA